jgi:hypothetical protein
MAGKNINQLNVASSVQSTDKLYLGRSPYGSTDDHAILWSTLLGAATSNFLAPVADVTALKAIDITTVTNGAGIYVRNINSFYFWRPGSIVTADNLNYVAPNTGSGNWIVGGPQGKVVSAIASSPSAQVQLPVPFPRLCSLIPDVTNLGYLLPLLTYENGFKDGDIFYLFNSSGSNSTTVYYQDGSTFFASLNPGDLLLCEILPTTATLGAAFAVARIATTSTPGVLAYSPVTASFQGMAANQGYIANNASLVTFALPTTIAVGGMVAVAGQGAGGWKITQSAGQQINLGNLPTTVGVGGSLQSTNRYDNIKLMCIVANTTFIAFPPQGNITVV